MSVEMVDIDALIGRWGFDLPTGDAPTITSMRTIHERVFAMCAALVNHGFLVLLAVWIPVAVQLVIFRVRGLSLDPTWLALESYGIATLTSIALFAELLKDAKGRMGSMLRAYNALLHWLAPLAALGCVLAIVALAVDPDNELAALLSEKRLLAVLIPSLLYVSYEIPTLWAATEVLEQPITDRNPCYHCGGGSQRR